MRDLSPSGIRAIFDRAQQLEAEGRRIVHLEIGRPHASSPPEAVEAARRALADGLVHYTANRGLPELRAEIARRLARDGREYDPDTEIVVTAGGSEAVVAALAALLEPGDEAIVLEPAWPHYAPILRLAGAVPVTVAATAPGRLLPDPEAIAAAAGPRTRAIVVSSPCNPSGAVFPRPLLEAIARLCAERDLYAISDEIYEAFVYGDARHHSIAACEGMREQTVVVNSCSKTYAMTGWRVGWAAAPAPIATRINTVHQYLSVCAPSFAQAGALAALREGDAFVAALVAEYAQRRDEVVAAFADLPGADLPTADGAFYAFPRIDGIDDAEPLAARLLEEHGVAVVPGRVFGDAYASHLRISYAVERETLAEGLAAIREALERGA